jgi:hypothetical protein
VQQYGQTGNVRCFVQDGGRRHIFFLLIIYMLYYYLSMYKCCTRVDIKIPTKMLATAKQDICMCFCQMFTNKFITNPYLCVKIYENSHCCNISINEVLFKLNLFTKAKKKYVCVYCHMSKKSRVCRSGLFFFIIIIIDKTGNSRSGIRFRYLIFENDELCSFSTFFALNFDKKLAVE